MALAPVFGPRPGAEPVVITGLGAVTPLGADPEALYEALCAGRSALGPAPYPGPGLAACLPGRPAASALAVAAARQATRGLPERRGLWVVCGTTAADLGGLEAGWAAYAADPSAPPALERQLGHHPAEQVRAALGSRAPAWGVSTACTSGAVALAQAAGLVQDGLAPAALALGVDALCALTWEGFGALGLRAPGPCRPFDAGREGLSLGEGAAALLLEPASAARRRGARPLAVLEAVGLASDARDLSAPHPDGEGLRRAIQAAVGGGEPPGWVIAHATGTRLNDAAEARALGATLPGAAVGALKGALGHTLGAAAALDALVAVQVLQRGVLPPVIGLRESELGLDLARAPRRIDARWGMSTSAAFGGGSCAVLLRRPEEGL